MKKNEGIVLGIDLGTTFSCMAVYEADGECKVIPNCDGHSTTPSVINLLDEKKPVVGEPAVNKAVLEPAYTARLFKRAMGLKDAQGVSVPAFVHPDSGKSYTAEELSAFVIRFLVDSAEDRLGVKVKAVVISVPAYFESDARNATLRAGELAGVKVLDLVNEPTAGIIAFGSEKKESGTFLVFDMGGGTLDVTLVRVDGDKYENLAIEGDRNLGGSDVTNLIAASAAGAFANEYGIKISAETDPRLWQELIDKSEIMKRTLSRSPTASFMIAAEGKRLQIDMTREELNGLIKPILDICKSTPTKVMEAAQTKPEDVDEAILIGGSSRIAIIPEILREMFGKPPRTDINPDEAVAVGAAIFAAKMGAEAGLVLVDTEGHNVLPPPIEVTEITSHSLGCLAIQNGVLKNAVIIPANTRLPAEREQVFALVDANQTVAEVVITSGADGADPADCKIYGYVRLSGLPPRPPGDHIRVKYAFNADGTLHVTITDTLSGKSTSELKHGLGGLINGKK